jgi:hypothetical protein
LGENLTKIKSSLKHGEWLPWVRSSLKFSHDTAKRYIGLFDRKDILRTVRNLELTEAYRLLSQPAEEETPPDVIPDGIGEG